MRMEYEQILTSPKFRDTDHHFICISHVFVGIISLKSNSYLPKKNIFFICFNDSPSKMMKNAFYFILKALFVLKIFKFLS